MSVDGARVNVRQARDSLALTRRQQNASVRRAETDLAAAQKNADKNTGQTADGQGTTSTVAAARSALVAARQARDSALLQARQQVTSAEQQLKSANVSLASTKASVDVSRQGPTDGDRAQAQAQVDSAEQAGRSQIAR